MKTLISLFFTLAFIYSIGQKNKSQWLTFENAHDGYKFSYPPDWKIKDTLGEYTVFTTIEGVTGVEAEVNFLIIPNDNDSSQAYLDKFGSKVMNNIKSRPNFQLLTTKSQSLNLSPGQLTDFTNTKTRKDTEPVHSIIWHINKGKYIYRLFYRAKGDLDTKYLSIVADIFNSFSFFNGSKQNTNSVSKAGGTNTTKITSRFKEIEPDKTYGSTGTITFEYRNSIVTYNTVRAKDGNIWLQQNLGSLRVATASNDKESYGDLFQWGRWDDGHQVRTPANTSSNELNPNNPSGLKLINYNSFLYGLKSWWLKASDQDSWTAATIEQVTSTTGCDPCKAIGNNWFVPKKESWVTLLKEENVSDLNGSFLSTLKLPASGARDWSNGRVLDEQRGGYYWSSTPTIALAIRLNGFDINTGFRGHGFSIRCMKSVTNLSESSTAILYENNLSNHVYTLNSNKPLEKVSASIKENTNIMNDARLAKVIEVKNEVSKIKISPGESFSFIVKGVNSAEPAVSLHKLIVENKNRHGFAAKNLYKNSPEDQTIINLNVVKIQDGLYQLTPTKTLEKGEYFFAPKNVIGKTTVDVFAFSVSN